MSKNYLENLLKCKFQILTPTSPKILAQGMCETWDAPLLNERGDSKAVRPKDVIQETPLEPELPEPSIELRCFPQYFELFLEYLELSIFNI